MRSSSSKGVSVIESVCREEQLAKGVRSNSLRGRAAISKVCREEQLVKGERSSFCNLRFDSIVSFWSEEQLTRGVRSSSSKGVSAIERVWREEDAGRTNFRNSRLTLPIVGFGSLPIFRDCRDEEYAKGERFSSSKCKFCAISRVRREVHLAK